MPDQNSRGESATGNPSEEAQPTPIHVSAILVASVRAMSNALDSLGFLESDNRVVEQDGRLGFVTCSHEIDCDDMFALIAELASSGETWEIQFQADVGPDRVLTQTLSRHRPIVAHEQQVPIQANETDGAASSLPIHDLSSSSGMNSFQRAIRNIRPSEVFAEIGAGPDGRARASIVQRNPRRVLAEAAAQDEPSLRAALREAIPKLMFTVSRRFPS